MIKHIIQITIVDDSGSKKCEGYCGIDWSSAEAMALASQRIKDRFGDKIQLKYLDQSNAMAKHDALEWSQAAKNQDLPLPLLIINGQLRISGQFDIRQLLDAIEAEMEIKT